MALGMDIDNLYNDKQALLDRYKTRANSELSINGTAAQAALNEAREVLREENKRAEATAVVSGATPESVALQKQANANAFAQAQRQLAGNLASQRVSADQAFLQHQQQLYNERIQRKQQQQQNIANAIGGVVQAGLSVAGTAIGGPVGGAIGGAVGGGINKLANSLIEKNYQDAINMKLED